MYKIPRLSPSYLTASFRSYPLTIRSIHQPILMNSLKPSWKKILVPNSRSKVLVHSGILILPIMSLLYFKIRFRLILPSPIFTVKLKFPVNNSKDKN